jgi:hypothetical protein
MRVKQVSLRLSLIAVIVTYSFTINAAIRDVYVKATIDNSTIVIGDQVKLHLEAEMPVKTAVQFPQLKDTFAGAHIEIVKFDKKDSVDAGNDRIRKSMDYIITSFDSGVYEIPPLPFVSGTDTAFTLPILLTVNNLEIKADKPIFDIKDILKVKYTWKEILTLIILFQLVIAFIGLIVYFIYRKKQHKPFFEIKKPDEPAHVTAFRELEKLKAEKVWQQGKHKEYYSRLTNIIRTYIEKRFLVLAMESTTDEIMFEIRKGKHISNELSDLLEKMLRMADMVKFAKAEPKPDENEGSWDKANDFVKQTRIQQESTENNPATEEETQSNNEKVEA